MVDVKSDSKSIADIKKIKGPFTLTEMCGDKRRIYMFGDYHERLSTCKDTEITLDLFIKLLANENPTKIFDLFLEYSVSKDKTRIFEYKESYMKDIIDSFESCIIKRDCKNLRVHYADIREYGYNDYFSFVIKVHSHVNLLYEEIHENKTDDVTIYRKSLETLLNNTDTKYFADDITLYSLVMNSKAKKNITDNKDPTFRKGVDTFMNDNNFIKVKWQDIRELYTPNQFGKYSNAYEITDKLNNLLVQVTDLYLIGRVFKKSLDTKNIIIYMGNDHINNYRYILQDMGFKPGNTTTSRITGKDFQCIDVEKFQPFFKD